MSASLVAGGLLVAVVNPRPIRDFAKATGKVATTDTLDAHTLDAHVVAHFADAGRPASRPPPAADTQALAAILAQRRQLVAMLTAEQSRLHTTPTAIRERIGAHITTSAGSRARRISPHGQECVRATTRVAGSD